MLFLTVTADVDEQSNQEKGAARIGPAAHWLSWQQHDSLLASQSQQIQRLFTIGP